MSKAKSKVMPLTKEQQKLIEDYLSKYEQQMYKCIHNTVKRQLDDEEMEELISVAHLGLCKAARNFKEGRGTQFHSFAYLNMSSAVKNAIRGETSQGRLFNKLAKSLDEPLDDTDKIFIKDVVVGTNDIEIFETSLRIVQYLHKLPSKSKLILRLRIVNDWDYLKIKEHLGLNSKEMREMLLRLQDHDNVKILRRDERNNGYKNKRI